MSWIALLFMFQWSIQVLQCQSKMFNCCNHQKIFTKIWAKCIDPTGSGSSGPPHPRDPHQVGARLCRTPEKPVCWASVCNNKQEFHFIIHERLHLHLFQHLHFFSIQLMKCNSTTHVIMTALKEPALTGDWLCLQQGQHEFLSSRFWPLTVYENRTQWVWCHPSKMTKCSPFGRRFWRCYVGARHRP